jgi:hypothetical protein
MRAMPAMGQCGPGGEVGGAGGGGGLLLLILLVKVLIKRLFN